jgi:glycolate oxidase FAD binding subunit
MTVTVRTGITVRELQALLRRENQRLAVDVPFSDRATLGGAIATNVSGPRRFGFGTFRDYVIGISVVNDLGQEIKAGGRVVKNVAGYDLMKLYTGSFGTLGILSQVTLKLKPLPEAAEMVVTFCHPSELERILEKLHNSQTRPVSIDVLSRNAVELINKGQSQQILPSCHLEYAICVGFEESRQAIQWQRGQLNHELPDEQEKMAQYYPDETAQSIWTEMTDFAWHPAARVSFKASLLPSRVTSFLNFAPGIQPSPLLLANAGNGIVYGHWLDDLSFEQAKDMLSRLLRQANEASGNLVITRCPPEWKATLPIWGSPQQDWDLMKTVKEKLDSGKVFNPGRFVDRI